MERQRRQLIPTPEYPNIYVSRRLNNGSFSLGRSLIYGLGVLALATVYTVYIVSARLAQEARDNEIAKWVLRADQTLKDPANLKPAQKYYARVRVVGAGRDLVEKWDMESRGGVVNIRRGPDREWEIVGQVKVGNVIHNVMVENNWAAVRCNDIDGLVPVDQATTIPEMCAMNADYLQK